MAKKSQKHRRPQQARTGSHAGVPAASHPVERAGPEHATLLDVSPRADLAAAAEREGSPAIPVSALIVTTLLVGAYYHLLVLQQMTQLSGGLAMPDSLLFYGQDHIRALSAVMDEDARGQLN
ncbi:hypothetical protein ACWDYA_14005, partial [Micrococcus luteus]